MSDAAPMEHLCAKSCTQCFPFLFLDGHFNITLLRRLVILHMLVDMSACWSPITCATNKWRMLHLIDLKLYCRYLYTRPYMINRIWSLKQLCLQVIGHAWFHLHGLRWPVRNGEGAKNSKWKYIFPAGFEPTPRQSMTGKSVPQTARPRWLDIKWSIIVIV